MNQTKSNHFEYPIKKCSYFYPCILFTSSIWNSDHLTKCKKIAKIDSDFSSKKNILQGNYFVL